MKPGRRLLLAALGFGLVAVVVAALLWPEQRGPSYQGKTLTDWLDRYAHDDPTSPEGLEAIAAVRHIGTNGLPFLLKRINHETPAWKRRLPAYLPRALWVYARRPLARVLIDDQAARSDRAILAFAILREEATPAISTLTNLLSHYERRNTSVRALMALSYIGTNGLMIVVAVITNASYPAVLRSSALSRINAMGTDAAPAVPILVDALNDPKMGQQVAMRLGMMKLRPDVVVPSLIKYLRTGDAPLAGIAADVLGEFGPEASNAVPDLLIATTNADAFLRSAATNALQAISPEVYGSIAR